MALEDKLDANTAAMEKLTAALLGSKPAPGGGKGGTTTTPAAEPKISFEDLTKLALRVRNEISVDKAKELIKDAGKAKELKAVAKENFDALAAACNTALEEAAAAKAESDI